MSSPTHIKELRKEIESLCGNCDRPDKEQLGKIILSSMAFGCSVSLETPSVERPQGEWIYGEHDVAMCDGYKCDRCGFFIPWDYKHKSIDFINDYNYCPNCGANMHEVYDE